MKSLTKHTVCVAYASMGLLFIVSGISKIADFSGSVGAVTAQGLPLAKVLIVLAIAAELIGGVTLFFKKKVCLGASILLVYLIVVTLVFHIGEGQLTAFLTNLAIFGGLLLVKSQACNCGTCDIGNKKKGKKSGCCGGGNCS